MPNDVVFLASPYTFDPFIVQMFIAFAAGARLVIVPDSVKMVPSKLCEILFDEERVTILQVRALSRASSDIAKDFAFKKNEKFVFQSVEERLLK